MSNTDFFVKYPLLKYTLLLLFMYLFVGGLYFARPLLIPLSFAALLAMLMLPVCRTFERWHFHRGVAILLCILIIVLTLAGLVILFSTQIIKFAAELPLLQQQLKYKLDTVQDFIENTFHISPDKQIGFLEASLNQFLQSVGTYLSMILVATTGTLATIGIIVIYIFFFMYYRDKFHNFLLLITPVEKHDQTTTIITQISVVTQQYLSGVLIVVVILAILNSTGLMIIGIRHALFFGILAGILNIIPYIGSFVGGLLPCLMALLTKESFGPAIAVVCVFLFNQFLENNFLTPHIVGGKVKINPLFTIIALLIGGYLWGVAGMIMFIPFLGIAKIIFDNIEGLKPYGFLIGEEPDNSELVVNKMRRWIKKRKQTANNT